MAYKSLSFGVIRPINLSDLKKAIDKEQIKRKKDRRVGFLNTILDQEGRYLFGAYAVEEAKPGYRIDEKTRDVVERGTNYMTRTADFVVFSDGFVGVQRGKTLKPERFVSRLADLVEAESKKEANRYIVPNFDKKTMKKLYLDATRVKYVEVRDVGSQTPNPWGTTNEEQIKLVRQARGLKNLTVRAEQDENIKEKELVHEIIVPYSRLSEFHGVQPDNTKMRVRGDKGAIEYNEPSERMRRASKIVELSLRVKSEVLSYTSEITIPLDKLLPIQKEEENEEDEAE